MKKITQLRTTDVGLLLTGIAILVSGIRLEVAARIGRADVVTHIVLGLAFMALCAVHVYLHFGRAGNWLKRFRSLKSQWTRILWWTGVLTAVTGLIAMVHWCVSEAHSPLEGVHGKLGLLMMVFAAGHTLKRRVFFVKMWR